MVTTKVKERPILLKDDGTEVVRPWKWKGGRLAAQRRYRENNRKRIKARKRAHYKRNHQAERKRQSEYRRKNKERIYAYNRAYRKRYYAELRREMISAYGGACACCNESEPLFLQLDHKNGGGRKHVAKVGNAQTLLKWLKDRNWPKDEFQLLCANCNIGRYLNGGICPHN